MFFHENALNPTAFPSLRQFESEVTAMAADMLGGDEHVVGNLTSGGSESVMMAVKTARDWARKARPEITQPEMLLPITAHPAFMKAAHYFDVKPVHISVASDYRADAEAARSLVTDDTILIVGSAPAYPHGVIDPIEELAALAQEKNILCHVDACLGGFMLPFVSELGYPLPAFDFQVLGVTSMSADIHKYGYAAKGASVVLYRNRELRLHQLFAYPDWPGGAFISPSMTGTRPGGAIAAAWAVIHFLGKEGYVEIARSTMRTTEALMQGIAAIPGLQILGKPHMSVFAFASDRHNVLVLADLMESYGWHMDRQHSPDCLHFMVTPAHEGIVDVFLSDLQKAVTLAETDPEVANRAGSAAMYGMVGAMPDRGMVRDFLLQMLDDFGTYKKASE
jgi:sphinganine-1-phosphate aldolase